jgi:hypothetical protein
MRACVVSSLYFSQLRYEVGLAVHGSYDLHSIHSREREVTHDELAAQRGPVVRARSKIPRPLNRYQPTAGPGDRSGDLHRSSRPRSYLVRNARDDLRDPSFTDFPSVAFTRYVEGSRRSSDRRQLVVCG